MAATHPFAGKVALITGGSKGIGAAVVSHLHNLGASVVFTYGSDAAPAETLVQKLGSDRVLPLKSDASSLSDIDDLVKATVERFGKIDILMPNAAMMMMKTVEQTSPEDFDMMYNLNVKGPYFLCQKALPHIPSGGHIILVSTGITAVSSVLPGYLLYASTKGAIEQMTRVMAKDLGRRGIVVNAVSPGPTGTDLFFQGKDEKMLELVKSWNPLHKIGEPEDIAKVVAFLAGEGSGWVNGQILRADGGMTVKN